MATGGSQQKDAWLQAKGIFSNDKPVWSIDGFAMAGAWHVLREYLDVDKDKQIVVFKKLGEEDKPTIDAPLNPLAKLQKWSTLGQCYGFNCGAYIYVDAPRSTPAPSPSIDTQETETMIDMASDSDATEDYLTDDEDDSAQFETGGEGTFEKSESETDTEEEDDDNGGEEYDANEDWNIRGPPKHLGVLLIQMGKDQYTVAQLRLVIIDDYARSVQTHNDYQVALESLLQCNGELGANIALTYRYLSTTELNEDQTTAVKEAIQKHVRRHVPQVGSVAANLFPFEGDDIKDLRGRLEDNPWLYADGLVQTLNPRHVLRDDPTLIFTDYQLASERLEKGPVASSPISYGDAVAYEPEGDDDVAEDPKTWEAWTCNTTIKRLYTPQGRQEWLAWMPIACHTKWIEPKNSEEKKQDINYKTLVEGRVIDEKRDKKLAFLSAFQTIAYHYLKHVTGRKDPQFKARFLQEMEEKQTSFFNNLIVEGPKGKTQ